MKPFSLEEYLKNPSRKVVTRDKRNVRILCTDKRGSKCPIVALVEEQNNVDGIYTFTKDGSWYVSGEESILDLFFAPERHEGWVNIYLDTNTNSYSSGARIYETKEEAEKSGKDFPRYLKTIKIEWED